MGLFKKPPILESSVVVKKIMNCNEMELMVGSFFNIEIEEEESNKENPVDTLTKAVLFELSDGSTKMIDLKEIKFPEQLKVGDKGILTYIEQKKHGFFGTFSRQKIICFVKTNE